MLKVFFVIKINESDKFSCHVNIYSMSHENEEINDKDNLFKLKLVLN
jgi:hypothetical protein